MSDEIASIAKKEEEIKANEQKQILQAMQIPNAPKASTELDDMVDMHIDQAHPNPQFVEALDQRKFIYIDACSFLMKVVGNKQLALAHFNAAEKLKKV